MSIRPSLTLSAILLTVLASAVQAQNYALLSPPAVQRLAAQRDTPQAKKILHEAEADLARTPHPVAKIHTEGTLPHQGIRDQSIEAKQDWPIMENFAFAYRLSGDKRYLARASAFLDAWLSLYRVSGNPIDEMQFDAFYLTLDLTRGDLAPDVERRAIDFFRGMSSTYLDWLDANYVKDPDNWSSHRVKLATLGAYTSGDAALIQRSTRAFLRQVKQNIRPDGSVDDFYKRDALHYVTYDLEPLTTASLAAKAHGLDWFHTAKTGSPSVEMAVDWLIPFATGQKTHMEFVHSTVAFDAARDKAGQKGYSGAWEPRNSIQLYALATWFDPRYGQTLEKVVTATGGTVDPWLGLMLQPMPRPAMLMH